ncbi:MAG: TIM barrel protein [Bacteroidetes bacterium]|nr:TIM barrel protein [Bacteroidota bacterium]
MLPIAVVTDEISRDLRQALALVQAWGLDRIELREGGTARFPAFTPDEFAALDAARAEGTRITAVSPGIFKGDIRDADRWQRELHDTLPRTLDAAARLGCGTVIAFGFERFDAPDDARARVVEAFAAAADLAQAAGMRLAIENEPGFWIGPPEASAALMRDVNHPALGLNWDPANLHWGGHRPTYDDFRAVLPHLFGLHVKDFYPPDPGAPWRALGEGVTPWPDILRWVVNEAHLPHITLETHTEPLEDASRRSLVTLRGWLKDAANAPVRVGLVGLGGHGRTLQHAAEAAAGVEVVAVYDPNADEAALAAERFGVEASPSYEALLDTPGLDAVVLVTPNAVHRAQTEAALARGVHVLVEKPLAGTLDDAVAMLAAADTSGRVLMVGHNQRYGAPAQAALEAIRAGRIGEVVSMEIHYSSDTGVRLPPDAWRLRPGEVPLLPVTQLGLHGLDLVHALVGPISTTSAVARNVRISTGVADSVVAHFTTGTGAFGTLVSHYCTPVRFAWTITGTDGLLDGTVHTLDLVRPGEPTQRLVDVTDTPLESYTSMVEAFAAAVRTGSPPSADGRAGFLAQAVVEAMAASASAHGAPVAVPSVPTETPDAALPS